MNKLLTWLLSVAPARHKIHLFQIRYQRAVRVLRAVLSQPALIWEV
jgi:hypothetical protein